MKFTADFKLRLTAFLIATILLPSILNASFQPLPVGGRAAGMGEAYSAIVDDVYAVYYNPAGVLQLERPEIGSYYSKLYSGLTDNSQISRTFIAYGQPVQKGKKSAGSFAVSYLTLDLSGLYKEETLGLTYGREFRYRWNVGGSLKVLRKTIGSSNYALNSIDNDGNATATTDSVLAGGKSATALGADIGVQYRLTRFYALGVTARNINSPDVALGKSADKVPAVYNIALARRYRHGSLDVEVMNWKSAGNNTRLSLGGEMWFKNGFGLRAGGGMGTRNYSTLAFGASYKMESIQFDYATILPLEGVQGTLGTQQISLTIRLGKPPVDPIETQLAREKEQRLKAETEARLAIAERDRLKKQLIDLTEAKSQSKQREEEQSAQEALEEARRQAAQQRQPATATGAEEARIFAEYTADLAQYNSEVQKGAGLARKKQLLESIQNKFANTKVNLSTVRRELKSLQVDEARAKKDFELSMNFYQRLVQQGASQDERRTMLERIIQKYTEAGIDVRDAEEEVNKLK